MVAEVGAYWRGSTHSRRDESKDGGIEWQLEPNPNCISRPVRPFAKSIPINTRRTPLLSSLRIQHGINRSVVSLYVWLYVPTPREHHRALHASIWTERIILKRDAEGHLLFADTRIIERWDLRLYIRSDLHERTWCPRDIFLNSKTRDRWNLS